MVGARRRRRSHAVTLPGASSLARADPPNLACILLGEPQVAIRPGRDADGEAIMRMDAELSDAATGSDAPDLANEFREPEVAIRPGRDALRHATGRGDRELGDGVGQDESSAQAQQVDTGNQGGAEGD